MLVVRPLNGDADFVTALFPEEVADARFEAPSTGAGQIGDDVAAGLLRTAMRIGFTAAAGPFRSLASIAVEPRQYQLVPLLLALRQDVVRLLIGDDVGVGKTVEAGLIARELLDQGEAARLTVLCAPALAEQWEAELREKFALDPVLVLPTTIHKLERDAGDQSVFDRHPVTVVSTDFVKQERYRSHVLRHCGDLVIVDEAHTCVPAGVGGRSGQLRYELLRRIAEDRTRHLILVTATPHSGNEQAFRDLVGLLDPELADLALDTPRGRDRLARHFVQRRRHDIRRYLEEETLLPHRRVREADYVFAEPYAKLHRGVLDYVRESVNDPAVPHGVRARVRWWSALALLRAMASSPRAAAASLRTRSAAAAAESPEEADALARAGVLDLTDDDALEGVDAAPGADDDELPRTTRERLAAWARDAEKLEGPDADAKLKLLIKEVNGLIADGYDPIVFCRFIPTAEYVAEHLGRALGRRAKVAAVTGTLQPPERIARIGELTADQGRHVLVATDCLSEGVNLQQSFRAVVHYDLAWNPTRHEQREGRVDRFGQHAKEVRAITMYGRDNGIDGIVLNVLIKKHRQIASRTGVNVPVPQRSDNLVQALVEGLLVRRQDPDTLPLDFGVAHAREALHRDWESAADRETRTLTKYAHSGMGDLDAVRAAADRARAAVAGPADVARFVREALSALGAPARPNADGFSAPAHPLPPAVRSALGLDADGTPDDLVFRFSAPAPRGEHALVRTDPLVAALGRYVLDAALDGDVPAHERPARRCGVIRTRAVAVRTTLLLVRHRLHVRLPGARELRTFVAEDARIAAYRPGADGERVWLADDDVLALLSVAPDGNVLPEQVTRNAERAVGELPDVQSDLDAHGTVLADQLLTAHQEVRSAAGAPLRRLSVTDSGHADVLGVYVYLPSAPASGGSTR